MPESLQPGSFRHWLAFIDIARRQMEGQQHTLIVDNQVQFEAREPINRGFAALSYLCEDFM